MRRFLEYSLVLAAALVASVLWFGSARIDRLDVVPTRDETFATSVYGVAVMVGFAVAVAIARVRPTWALGVVAAAIAAQLLFWPARFSQISWTGYLLLALLPALLSRSTVRRRRPTLAVLLVCAAGVGAMLTVPALSISGRWGTVTGKELAGSLDAMALVIALALAVTLVSWHVGRPRVRAGRADAAHAVEPHPVAADRATAEAVEALSPREHEMFRLVAQGRSNAEIAAAAFIGETTVKTHVGSILRKLGLSSRSELIAFAWANGLTGDAEASVVRSEQG